MILLIVVCFKLTHHLHLACRTHFFVSGPDFVVLGNFGVVWGDHAARPLLALSPFPHSYLLNVWALHLLGTLDEVLLFRAILDV